MKRTAHGCDSLGDTWESLGHTLTVAGNWDESQSRRALRLLGLAGTPTPASPEPLWDFWLCVLSLRFERDPEPLLRTSFRNWNDAESVRRYLPDPAEARAALAEFVRERVAEMETLGSRLWDDYDAPSRASAEARAAFDAGPESARLERYLKDAERMRRQALDELARLRRDESRGLSPVASRAPDPTTPTPTNEPAPPAQTNPSRRLDRRKEPRNLRLRRSPRSPAPTSTVFSPGLPRSPPWPCRSVGPRASDSPSPCDTKAPGSVTNLGGMPTSSWA